MCPQINSVAQAEAWAGALHYGRGRGVALFPRGARFGTNPDAMRDAAERTLGIAQIESPEAVEAVEGIAAVDGIDVVFVGPSDLSHSMGIYRRFDDPRFRTAIDRVVEAANAAGKAAGIFLASTADAQRAVDDGFRMIGVGSDGGWMLQAARTAVSELRGLSRSSAPAG
jgi:4-hydroxy-2-oxoheptanedioate aldolase